jgi:hypothetical protein
VARRWRRYAVAVASSGALVCVLAAGSVPIAVGCYTHQCDPSAYAFCPAECATNPAAEPGLCPPSCVAGGHVVDENTYETTPFSGNWIPYPHMVTINIIFPIQFQRRIPSWIDSYIGTGDAPNDTPGDSLTNPSGQLVLYSFIGPEAGCVEDGGFCALGGFLVTNGTCADYSARFVVHFDSPDGGAGAGASPHLEAGAD